MSSAREATMGNNVAAPRSAVAERLLMGMSVRDYLRSLVTPFNIVAALVLAVGIPVIAYRFAYGLGASTNLSQQTGWGIWIGFDMMTGVALAAGGFVVGSAVHLFGLHKYHSIVRPAILTGFLGYVFAVLGLIADLGRPWNIFSVIYSPGPTSVMYEVAWCVMIYTTVLGLEFSVSLWEWLGWKRVRAVVMKAMVALTVLAVVLSTLHQSSLGSLLLLAPDKIHPLWYTPWIPLYFFVSAVLAGLSMVIVESTLSHKFLPAACAHEPDGAARHDDMVLGLGKAAAVVLFAFFFMKVQALIDGGQWHLLATKMGAWYLVEVLGFVALPCALFAVGVRSRSVRLVRWTAGLAVLGVVVNRLNISVVAFNWNIPDRYVPSWMEVVTSVTLVVLGILVFRWIANRMPVLRLDPAYPEE